MDRATMVWHGQLRFIISLPKTGYPMWVKLGYLGKKWKKVKRVKKTAYKFCPVFRFTKIKKQKNWSEWLSIQIQVD